MFKKNSEVGFMTDIKWPNRYKMNKTYFNMSSQPHCKEKSNREVWLRK